MSAGSNPPPPPERPRTASAPPRWLLWWEGLETGRQLVIAFPSLSILLFLVNLGPFSQPLLRSIFYGLFEGGLFTGLALVATRNERARRG